MMDRTLEPLSPVKKIIIELIVLYGIYSRFETVELLPKRRRCVLLRCMAGVWAVTHFQGATKDPHVCPQIHG